MRIGNDEKARAGLIAGMGKLADAVRVTLGPKGRNVAMQDKANIRGSEYSDAQAADAPILVTNDGVTIAKGIVLADPVQELGVRLVREAAIRANDEAGDGTTTTIILAHAMLEKAFRLVAAGADPLALRKGLLAAGDAALKGLRSCARPVNSEQEIAHVASISCQDEAIGGLIAKALVAVGKEGVVNVDDSRRMDTTLDIAKGIVFDRGLISPYLATDSSHQVAELEDAYILLTDKKITSQQDIIPALMCAAEDGKDCLVVCDGIEGEALALVINNNRQGDMNVACVLAPEYGEGRRWRMEDIAIQTGGMFVSEEMGLSIRDVDRAMLGSAKSICVDGKRTTISDAGGDPKAIAERIEQLRYYAENTEYEFNRKRHAERLAKFVSGVATISVGGLTEAEQRERRLRVEDAVNASRAAVEEGVVAGGGRALLDAAAEIEGLLATLGGDELAGAKIVADACEMPIYQIAKNAGKSGEEVLIRVKGQPAGFGYDAASDSYVDMLDAGIADPVRVTRSALEAALSVAGTVLLTDVTITDDWVSSPTIMDAIIGGGRR